MKVQEGEERGVKKKAKEIGERRRGQREDIEEQRV